MSYRPLSPGSRALLRAALQRFRLDRDGIHGVSHWGRVRGNGLRLAATTGANVAVVEAFAILHDCCREDDNQDPDHGARSAAFAEELVGQGVLILNTSELELLTVACRWHSHGSVLDDITISTCWDADRLDLGRIGIRPDPERLCTEAARSAEVIDWAMGRSLRGHELARSSGVPGVDWSKKSRCVVCAAPAMQGEDYCNSHGAG